MNFSLLNWDNLMSESFKPVEEDLYSTIEDLADYAGEIALEIYQKKIISGSPPTDAVKASIEAATEVMMDSGCPVEICDLLSQAAISGFTNYVNKNPNCDHMEAFNAAGDSIAEILESQLA